MKEKEEVIKIKKKVLIKWIFLGILIILSIIIFNSISTNYKYNKKMDLINWYFDFIQEDFDYYYGGLLAGYNYSYTLDSIEDNLYRIEEFREEILELDKSPFWKLDGTNKMLFDMQETRLEWDWYALEVERKK